MRSPVLVGSALCLASLAAAAQQPSQAAVGLGRALFHDKDLSITREVSCATCHNPQEHFADGLPRSRGVTGLEAGRNTPTLVAAGLLEHFPGARFERTPKGRITRSLVVMDLEERCLAPIANPMEMGLPLEVAAKRVARKRGMHRAFNEAFDDERGPPVTTERMGRALAAYVRSLELPTAPYQRYLEGDYQALNATERSGLDIFNGRGRCNACHSGPALSDGLVHVAAPPDAPRIRFEARRARERRSTLTRRADLQRPEPAELAILGRDLRGDRLRLLRRAQKQALRSGTGNSYYGNQTTPAARTTPLWDLARTAPYLRDGSVQDLRKAVTQHIEELQEVALLSRTRWSQGSQDAARLSRVLRRSRLPRSLLARDDPPLPDDLTGTEMDRLMAFLHALSPRPGAGAGDRRVDD